MDKDFVILGVSSERDPNGSGLTRVLQAQLNLEHARGIREIAVYLLAGLGVPVWLAAIRPGWLPRDLQTGVLTVWFLCLVGLVAAIAAEWRWRRIRGGMIVPSQKPTARGSAAIPSLAPGHLTEQSER